MTQLAVALQQLGTLFVSMYSSFRIQLYLHALATSFPVISSGLCKLWLDKVFLVYISDRLP